MDSPTPARAQTSGRPQAANDPDAGRLVALVRLDMRRRAALTSDLLSALGIRHDVTGKGRNEDHDWLLTHVWMVALRIRDVVLLGPHCLAPDLTADLAVLTDGVGARLRLISSPPSSDEQVAEEKLF